LEVAQTELVDRRGPVVDQAADRFRRGHRIEAWRGAKPARIRVHPDQTSDFLLLAQQDRLVGAAQDDDDLRRPLRNPAVGVEDRAEQQQLRPGETVTDLNFARGDVGDEFGLGRGREEQRSRNQQQGESRPHSISTV
jgi:hypothetical protein